MMKLTRFNGRLFTFSVLCDARRHRVDIFIDFVGTDTNYCLYRAMNQSGLALSSNFRSSVASWGTTLESSLLREIASRGFYYDNSQSNSGK
jgi:hypothetical protein